MKINGITNKKQNVLEWGIYLFIWLLFLLFPIFYTGSAESTNWQRVYHEWIRIIPFALVFLIHRLIFIPFLFNKREYVWYFIASLVLCLVLSIPDIYTQRLAEWIVPHGERVHEWSALELRQGRAFPPGMELVTGNKLHAFFNQFLISVLILSFTLSIQLFRKLLTSELAKNQLKQVQIETELNYLKFQISPHFFMNTLNNIHALIDVDKSEAQDSIIRLSKMMRYFLYDTSERLITLDKEVEFIKSYINLMLLRFDDTLDVEIKLPPTMSEVRIPGLIFINFIENAFKHGLDPEQSAVLLIKFSRSGSDLEFFMKNTLKKSERNEPNGGLGLINTRKRLELLYEKNFVLQTGYKDDYYTVFLKIPIYED